MNELALFAGAGGGLLGSALLGWTTVCAVELDVFCRAILKCRQDDGILRPFPIWDDICSFNGAEWRGLVDVVSGGFPCQAFSTATHRRCTAADLWPQMLRVVTVVAPFFVFAENVSRTAINNAANDCQRLGYRTEVCQLSAKDLGADHIRKRYWLLAYSNVCKELRCAIYAEASRLQKFRTSVWEAYAPESGMVDGLASWVDRFRAIGNGQVPIVAAEAWRVLIQQAAQSIT